MENILDAFDLQNIKYRIRSVSEDNKRRWGQMTTGQMFCHCADQIRLALGEKPATEKASWLNEHLVLPVALILPRLPRLKLRAPKDMKQGEGGLGTKPT